MMRFLFLVLAGTCLAESNHPLVNAPHNIWNGFNMNLGGFPSLNTDSLDKMRKEMIDDFDSRIRDMSSVFNSKVEEMSSVVNDGIDDVTSQLEGLDFGSHYDKMEDYVTDISSRVQDMGSHYNNRMDDYMTDVSSRVHGLANDYGLGEFPSYGDLFQVFGSVRKPWWKGENVCVDREEEEGEEGDNLPANLRINVSPSSHMHMQVSQCREEVDYRECTQSVVEDGTIKSVKFTYRCCHGSKRSVEGTQRTDCKAFDIRPMEETIASLEGTDFLSLLTESNLLEELENTTLFLPDNQALDIFTTELKSLQSGPPSENMVYSMDFNIDEGLLYRKKRNVVITEKPEMSEVLLTHISPNILTGRDIVDGQWIETKSTKKSGLRMTVYNTYPEKVIMANCAKVTSKDHHTTNGVIHTVDKVIQPATQTIGEILSSDMSFRTFMSSLDSDDLARLNSQSETLTVFVPTDEAFKNLENSGLSVDCSSQIIKAHIVPHIICSSIVDQAVKAINIIDDDLVLTRDAEGNVLVQGKKLLYRDIVGTNGVIHVLDSVILPESARGVRQAVEDQGHSALLDLLDSTSVLKKLSSLSNMTLFLPSARALAQIPQDVLDLLKGDEKKLEEMLLHHVLPENRDYTNFRTEKLTSLSGKPLHLQLHGSGLAARGIGTVDCARIVQTGHRMCSGSIHFIDRMLAPPKGHIIKLISDSENHKEFSRLIKFSGLSDEEHEGYTVFAPTDAAFKKLSEKIRSSIFEDKEKAALVVRHHIIPNLVCCSSLPSSFTSRRELTSAGEPVTFRRGYNGATVVNGASIIRCDTPANNGILHVVDSLILPSSLQETTGRRTFWSF